jgi:hypothetical protein
MVLETAQLLATAINVSGGKASYRTTHVNHPCSIWVRQSKGNYQWTLQLFKELLQEYENRYGRIHKCRDYMLEFCSGVDLMPEGEMTPFVNCTPFKDEADVFVAYKACLQEKWKNDKRKPTWKGLSHG